MTTRPQKASTIEMEAPASAGQTWQSRITGHGEEPADQLLANPRNWRIHPLYQQEALASALDKIGWVQNVIVNTVTGHVIDGHLRVALALSKGETVPVTYVELSEDEEQLALATLDPIAALAATDEGALKGLLADLEGQVPDELATMLQGIAGSWRPDAPPSSPSQEQIDRRAEQMSERFEGDDGTRIVDVTCPQCAHEFGVDINAFQSR